MPTRVVICETPFIHEEYQYDRLETDECEVAVVPVESEADVVAAASDANALIVDVSTPVTAEAIENAPDLQLIARCGTGYDNIDIETAAEHGVAVTNAPEYCTNEVATHAFGLFLTCRRRIAAADREVRNLEWSWQTDRPVRRVPGSTVGLVSFGTIARRFADYTAGFDIDLLVFDPYVDAEVVEEYGARLVDFDELLAESDAISVHAPLTPDTRGMFSTEEFEQMQDRAVIINVGRGGIIDEEALATALENDEIAAAGLDVLEREPPEAGHPLEGLEDVVITPHAAWYSVEAQAELNETVAKQVEQALAGDEPDHAVNVNGWH